MSSRKSRYLSVKGWTMPLIVGAILISMVLIACGSSAPPEETGAGSAPGGDASVPQAMETGAYASLKGDIDIDGSSTVFPITEAVAEEFGKLTNGNVRVTVGVSGTGGGFKKFCNGEIQISDASRPIRASEVQLCADAGIEYIEIPVAIDGLTVIVNKGQRLGPVHDGGRTPNHVGPRIRGCCYQVEPGPPGLARRRHGNVRPRRGLRHL